MLFQSRAVLTSDSSVSPQSPAFADHASDLQLPLFAQCDGVNVEDLLTSQLDELARGMRRELRKECDLSTCSYDVESGSSLKIREDGKFKVATFSRSVCLIIKHLPCSCLDSELFPSLLVSRAALPRAL